MNLNQYHNICSIKKYHPIHPVLKHEIILGVNEIIKIFLYPRENGENIREYYTLQFYFNFNLKIFMKKWFK